MDQSRTRREREPKDLGTSSDRAMFEEREPAEPRNQGENSRARPGDAGTTQGGGSLGHHEPPGVPEPPDPLPEPRD